jgi:hypothetical protein
VARPGRLDLLVGCIVLGLLMAFGVVSWAAGRQHSSDTVVATESAVQSEVGNQPDVEAVAPPAPSPSATTGSRSSDAAPASPTAPSTTETTPTEADPTVTDPLQPWTEFPVESLPAQSPFVGTPFPPPGSPAPTSPPSQHPPPTAPPPQQPPPDVTGPAIADAYQFVDCGGLFCLEVLSTSTDQSGVDAMEIYFAVDADIVALVAACPASPCSWSNPTGYGLGTTLNYLVRARDRAGNWSQTPLRTLVL